MQLSATDIDRLRADIGRLTGKDVMINIEEIRKAETDATLVADHIAGQLMRRMAFRRVIRRSVQTAMKLGVQGIKVAVSGRLGGAEIARAEWYREGRVPLHTLRADIDFAIAEAHTKMGRIGVKCWICRGEVFGKKDLSPNAGQQKGPKVPRGERRGGARRGPRNPKA